MSPSACGKGGAARLAVQAYVDGTNALDAGRTAEGIRLLRRAIDAEPALDAEEWPEWAEKLRRGLERAAACPPPMATADIDLGGAACMSTDQTLKIADAYRRKHVVIIDGALPSLACELANAEASRADARGDLEMSTVYANSSSSAVSVALPDRRSDRIRYLDLAADAAAAERQWLAIGDAIARVDAIAASLREQVPEELGEIAARQRPMVSAYDAGARFERHCDNHCHEDEDEDDPDHGHCANRRRLSAVLYCVDGGWTADCGGALRIYRSAEETGGWEGDDALVDVLPRAGRLVLFASDQRVPHEVLPVTSSGAVRYALALWFLAPAAPTPAAGDGVVEERGAGSADAREHDREATPSPTAAADAMPIMSEIVEKARPRKPLAERESATSVIAEIV